MKKADVFYNHLAQFKVQGLHGGMGTVLLAPGTVLLRDSVWTTDELREFEDYWSKQPQIQLDLAAALTAAAKRVVDEYMAKGTAQAM